MITNFTKMQGTGNDFVILDTLKVKSTPSIGTVTIPFSSNSLLKYLDNGDTMIPGWEVKFP